MLKTAVPLRAALCTLSVSILSACGGGGGSPDQPEASAKPASVSNTISVEGGNSAVASGQYAVDISSPDTSGTAIYDEDLLEVVFPGSSLFASAFIFSQSHPDKFAVYFADGASASATVFACRSGSWSTKEIAALEGDAAGGTSIALCPNGITIDPVAHSIKFTGLQIPALSTEGKSVTLGADFSWVLQHTSSIKVETGSSIVATGTYLVTGGANGANAYGDMILGQAEIDTEAVTVTLMQLQEDDGKFIVQADVASTSAAAKESYACASKAWTTGELAKLRANFSATLTTCPDSVNYNVDNRLLTLDKAALPVLNAANGHQLVLSLSEVWAKPNFPISGGSTSATSAASAP